MQNTRIYICSHADETHPHALRRSRAQSYRGFRYLSRTRKSTDVLDVKVWANRCM